MRDWDRIARTGAAWRWGERWSTFYAIGAYARTIGVTILALAALGAVVVGGLWLSARVPGVVLALAAAGLCLVLGVGRLVYLFFGRSRPGAERGAWLLVLTGVALVVVAIWAS